jgi:hypothetical protein
MAFTQVSAKYENRVKPSGQSLNDIERVHLPAAHSQHGADIGGILAAGDPGQIGGGIGAPVTQKRQDFWFECPVHGLLLGNWQYLTMTPGLQSGGDLPVAEVQQINGFLGTKGGA